MQFTSNKTSIYPRYNVSNDNNDRVPQLFSKRYDASYARINYTDQNLVKNEKSDFHPNHNLILHNLLVFTKLFCKNEIIHPHVEISPYKDLEECVCLY